MVNFSDEVVAIAGFVVSYILLLLVKQLEWISLWGSLIVLVATAMFYSFTFFRASNPFPKFLYFLLTVPVLIGYFALVYKSFGIIDTSTNETIKPDWIDSLYFSVVTWTTLGYGDFKPIHDLKMWVIAEALMGYIFMGLLLAKLVYLSQRTGQSDA